MKGNQMERVGIWNKLTFEKMVDDEGLLYSLGGSDGSWKMDMSHDDLEELFKTIAAEFPDYAKSKEIHFVSQCEMMLTRVENILALTVDELQRLRTQNRKT